MFMGHGDKYLGKGFLKLTKLRFAFAASSEKDLALKMFSFF